ncbi:MAG: hypothetical protein ABSA15_03225 [Thermoplasmata archaeon]
MVSTAETATWTYRIRHGFRTHRAIISIIVLAVGLLITTLAIGAFTPLSSFVGPIVVIIGAYLVGAYYTARRKFEHLMRTKSKAEFLRNIPLLEELLWDLTPNDEVRYAQKREELRLPR